MYVLAPELSALIIILASPDGPVISTLLSWRSGGVDQILQPPSRIQWVSGRKSGSTPESISLCLRARRCRSSSRLRENRRTNLARSLIASWVRMSLPCSSEGTFEKVIPADSPLDPSSCSTTHPPLTLVFSADMRIVSDETEPREELPSFWV